MLEMQYEVDRILARRLLDPKEGTFEYLVAWKGFGTDGDTWESQETLNPKFWKAFDKAYDLEVELVLRRLRNFFFNLLAETKDAVFNRVLTFDSTIPPRVALAVLKRLALQRDGARPLKVQSAEANGRRKYWLELKEPQAVSDAVLLHAEHPEAGLGLLRVRHGNLRDKNLRAVFPLLLSYEMPLDVGGRVLTDGYVFKAALATWTFLNPTGHHDHPPASNADRLNNAKRGRLVEHVKKLVKEPWATAASWPKSHPRRHGLSHPPRAGVPAWADLPPARWELTPAEAMPA